MRTFDLHVHSAFSEGESTIGQLAKRAEELGYSGICFSEYYEGRAQLEKLKAGIAKAQRKTKRHLTVFAPSAMKKLVKTTTIWKV